ncbi:bypass-of-forespore protein C [Paenibacillus sp. LMG 31456]|uniref:Bypass-of-forespore protein C n=1 Tax=Paenibacillus foliorum TaxID=2654974 RepID=A0A972GXM0_9BACL|nr:BofC C-terminal domain-containing protein [Paenibacillus foliorum]NOU96048.1 bypass-of-forespore protein C [Paenibacillus foliorum]
MLFSLLGKLKKKLRWKRRWLNLAAVLLLVGIGSIAVILLRQDSSHSIGMRATEEVFTHQIDGEQPEEEVRAVMKQMNGQRGAYSQKTYVCGEEIQMLGMMNAQQILQYHKEHPNLSVKLNKAGEVIFNEKIEDLSPQCKKNAYFGLDAGGNLSLFEGVPEDKQVIRTFFQLNIQYLESSLPHETVKQLYRGIPINNLAEYNSVLSTFADFAVEEMEQLMN